MWYVEHKLNIADAVTISRIVFAVLLLFCAAFSKQFYVFYLFGGFSDMIDGQLARKLDLRSSFGAKLDTIADYVFAIAVLIKVLPAIHIPVWLWIWAGMIAFIKLFSLLSSLVMFRRIVPIHTVMNKVTGFMLFLLPFGFISEHSGRLSEIAVIIACSIATFTAIQEGYLIHTGKEIE